MEQLELAVKIAVDSWHATLARTSAVLNDITDQNLLLEVSAGRNTGIYLLGHLVAVHDKMQPLLGIGTQRYPHLDEIFLSSPDKSGKVMPPVAELRDKWEEVNDALNTAFSTMKAEDWLAKHTAVSDEDFAKQPHRCKLNVLASRTTHLAEHYGQLLFLKKRA